MFTVITKGNNVSKHNNLAKLGLIDHIIVITDGGEVKINKGNPITWPDSAISGMQAIVDVKAGTLRFARPGGPWAQTEFVLSEYASVEDCDRSTPYLIAEPFVSVEDCDPAHVLDLIKEWPSAANSPAALPDLPGFKWMFHEGKCWSICGMNGDTELFEGHWLNYHENKKKYAKPFVSLEDGDLSTPVQPKAPVTKEYVMKLIDIWPHDDNIPVNRDVTDNWIWSRKGHKNVIINLVDNVNSGVVITENDWRNYLSEELRKYPPVVSTKHDPVNRPSHYTAGGIECIDTIKASMSTEAFLGFLKGNVQKYMWRYEKKVAPVEDLKKAQWYLSKLIEEQERS